MRRFLTPVLLVLALVAGLTGCTSHPPLSGVATELTGIQHAADGTLTATVQFDNGSVLAINISSSHHDILLNGQLIGTLDLSEPLGLPAQHNFSQTGTVKLTGAAPAAGEASYQINSTLRVVTYGDSKELIKVGGSGTVTVK
ncbi:MAG TPA: hypothetical protein VHD32_17895 [Candidatus Didemnitutus sp.]|nr:hypothetical protein [Candidatus Didemnitutus sp.]